MTSEQRAWASRLHYGRFDHSVDAYSTDHMEAAMAKEPKNLDNLFHDT